MQCDTDLNDSTVSATHTGDGVLVDVWGNDAFILEPDCSVALAIELLKASKLVGEAIVGVVEERYEQIDRGFNAEHDDQDANSTGELAQAAAYIIDSERNVFPASWSPSWKNHFDKKDRVGALRVASALLVAEIDRLTRLNTKE